MASFFRKRSSHPDLLPADGGPSIQSGEESDVFKKHYDIIANCFSEESGQISGSIFGNWNKRLLSSFEIMMQLIARESQSSTDTSGRTGACMQMLLEKPEWLAKLKNGCMLDKPKGARLTLLRCFVCMFSTVQEPLLIHEAILVPLSQLIAECGRAALTSDEAEAFVEILAHIASGLAKDPTLLSMFILPLNDRNAVVAPQLNFVSLSNGQFLVGDSSSQSVCSSRASSPTQDQQQPQPSFSRATEKSAPPCNFALFAAMLPYMNSAGRTGKLCRRAMIQCIQLTQTLRQVVRFIVTATPFIQATTLILRDIFQRLPAKLQADPQNPKATTWRLLTATIDAASREYIDFLTFLNDVVKVAHHAISKRLCKFTYEEFFVPVVLPALHERSGDELVSTLAILDVTFNRLTDPRWMRELTNFINITHHSSTKEPRKGNVSTLDLLYGYFEDTASIGLATMRVFLTLLELYCEDIMIKLMVDDLQRSRPVASSATAVKSTYTRFSSAANELLALRPAFFQSPSGMNFENTLENARQDFFNAISCCRKWSLPYDEPVVPDASTVIERTPSAASRSSSRESSGTDLITATAQQSRSSIFSNSISTAFKPVANSAATPSSSSQSSAPTKGFFSSLKKSLQRTDSVLSAPKLVTLTLSRLERMLEQSVPANLLTTGIISRLCLYPQPVIRNSLLDSSSEPKPALFSVLERLTSAIRDLEMEEGFLTTLQELRGVSSAQTVSTPVTTPSGTGGSLSFLASRPNTASPLSIFNVSRLIGPVTPSTPTTSVAPVAPVLPSNSLWDSAGDPQPTAVLVSELHVISRSPNPLDNVGDLYIRTESWQPVDDSASQFSDNTPTSAPNSPRILERLKQMRVRKTSMTKESRSPVSTPLPPAALQATSPATTTSGSLESAATEIDKKRKMKQRRAAFAVLLFDEFLKELAAASLEHAVARYP